jgi:hypothetical protein
MTRILTRTEREKSFADAEASLKLEGLTPSEFYSTLKARILNGELTTDEAIAELDKHYQSRENTAQEHPQVTETRPRTHTIADSLTIDDPLLLDDRFINLLAKAETHQRQFRPKETAELEQENQLATVLFERTKGCWENLKAARQSGMTISEAQEVAFPIILVPDEEEQP